MASTKNSPEPTAARLPSLAGFIVEAGLLAAFISALVFVAGWSYADRYFHGLGINISALDGLATSSFSAYALWVFRDGWLAATGFVIAGLFGLALVLMVRLTAEGQRLAAALVTALLAALALFGAAYLGADRAEAQLKVLFSNNYATFPRITISAKDSPLSSFLDEKGDLGSSTCLRKLFMDHRNLYAYAGYADMRTQRPRIYVIPLSGIAAMEVITSNTALCDRT